MLFKVLKQLAHGGARDIEGIRRLRERTGVGNTDKDPNGQKLDTAYQMCNQRIGRYDIPAHAGQQHDTHTRRGLAEPFSQLINVHLGRDVEIVRMVFNNDAERCQ